MLNIYLTDLSAYNKGFLNGEWISLPMDDDELASAINKVLRGGEAICAIEYGYEEHEEWFISDYEWEEIDLFSISEYKDIFEINSQLSQLEILDCTQLKIIKFLLDNGLANDHNDAIFKCEDVIVYSNTNLKDYVYELIEELYDVNKLPSIIANNIDYVGIATDLSYEGRYYEIDNDLYEYIG